MELARLYPKWVASVLVAPQTFVNTKYSHYLLKSLKNSILHGAYLMDLFGSDFPFQKDRIQVSWVLWSYTRNKKYHIRQFFHHEMLTSTTIWPSATWFERELWEMFGVRSVGHSDLRRLLTDYGFNGRPMLKDFPVSGYVELRYSEKQKRVISRPVTFVQEFRLFDFKSPWQS